jgi:hypothetical protein
MPRQWPSVSGKFFLVLQDPATHYVIENGSWVKIPSWKDHPGYGSIDELAAIIAAGGDGYAHVNIAWVLDGRHWCLDLDTKNARKVAEAVCAADDVDRYVNMLTEQHATTAAVAGEYTFVERSRSGNGWHIVFDPGELDASAFGGKDHFGCAELYRGDHSRFIILTGNETSGADVDSLPDAFIPTLRDRFPVVEQIPAVLPDGATDGSRESVALEGSSWFWTGDGEPPKDYHTGATITDASVLRFMFLKDLAKQAWGMVDARERVWDAIANSWFATDYTSANSSNPDRFTRTSKIMGVKYKEVNKAFADVAVDAEKAAANAALVGPVIAASMAKVADDEQQKDAESLARACATPVDAPVSTLSSFPDFPVALCQDVRDFLRTTVVETEETLVNVATLMHMGAPLARAYRTDKHSLLNLYMVVLAKQGAGKEVLSGGPLANAIGFAGNLLKRPVSTIALHKAMVRTPCGLLILKEVGDRMSEWTRTDAQKGLFTLFKDVYGTNAGDSFTGASYSDSGNEVPNVLNPALSLLGEGTRQQTLDALTTRGKNDGFVARLITVEPTREWIDNDNPVRDVPDDLKRHLDALYSTRIRQTWGSSLVGPAPIPVLFAHGASDVLAALKDEERAIKRDDKYVEDDHPHLAFWRAATQNAQKLSCIMAAIAHAGLEGSPVVKREQAEWACAIIRRSIAQGISHMERDGAYSHDDRKAAKALEKMISNFFKWKPTTEHHARLRQKGQFTIGYLGRKHAGLEAYPKGPVLGLRAAVACLLSDRKIAYVDARKAGKFADVDADFRLGDMWGVEE